MGRMTINVLNTYGGMRAVLNADENDRPASLRSMLADFCYLERIFEGLISPNLRFPGMLPGSTATNITTNRSKGLGDLGRLRSEAGRIDRWYAR